MKKNNLLSSIFWIFLISFLVLYLSSLTGYFEYKNHRVSVLTEEEKKQFEEDVKNGVNVDINNYLKTNDIKYNNKLSSLASNISNNISKIVKKSVNRSFKYLSNVLDE